jgi:hypothetical protein
VRRRMVGVQQLTDATVLNQTRTSLEVRMRAAATRNDPAARFHLVRVPVIREQRANAKIEPLPRISANGSSPFLET